MSTDIDTLSRQLGELPHDHPAKIIGAIAINGMWFVQYVHDMDPGLYRRARAFAIDCTKVAGVCVEDLNGKTRVRAEHDEEGFGEGEEL